MNEIISIYLIENKTNNKKYIGQTINYNKRMKEHIFGRNARQNSVVDRAIKKYGKDLFHFSIIDKASDQNEADNLERIYIKKYDCLIPSGYNVLIGGRKQQGSWNQKKVYMYNLNGEFEKEFESASELERISNSFYMHSQIASCCNGKSYRYKDKMFRYEYSEKINAYKKPPSTKNKQVFQFDLDGTLIKRYKSIVTAASMTNTSRTSILGCIKGTYKTANGFKWSYNNQSNSVLIEISGINVLQVNDNGDIVAEYVSCAHAERILKLRKGAHKTISSVVDKNKKRYGFYWKRKDNPVPSL